MFKLMISGVALAVVSQVAVANSQKNSQSQRGSQSQQGNNSQRSQGQAAPRKMTKNEQQVKRCEDRIENECRGNISLKAVFKGEGRTECKQVSDGFYENSTHKYMEKIVLTDSNSIVSVRIPPNSAQCDVTRFEVFQGFKDETVFGGRMITVAGNGKIYVVARNNEIHELFDRNNRSYNDVVSVKVDQARDLMTVNQKNGESFPLKLSTVTNRLNNREGSKCIAGCSGKTN